MTKPSLRKSINEFCKWCIYDPLSGLGNWRQQVEGCTATDCPLYEVRPKSNPEPGRRRQNGPAAAIIATTPSTEQG